MMNDQLIKVLTEIHNRLNDIALTLQVIGLMNIIVPIPPLRCCSRSARV